MEEHLILVDENDNQVGTEEKMQAHKNGNLHRAFSIFVFNSKGQLLIQKREESKYHCGGLWANTCCSHPRPNESLENAIHRRLMEEMGFDCALTKEFSFIYKEKFKNGLTENEVDHVFTGTYDNNPLINPKEVSDYKWISMEELKEDISKNPGKYTPWFKIALKRLKQ